MTLQSLGVILTPGLLVLGAISGLTYGILAAGLVLAYRSSGVLNFAHGEIGAFGAAVCGVLVVRWGVPFWVAFAAALATSAATGSLTEVAVVRRLREAPKLMSLVATLGVAQFLLACSSLVNAQARSGSTFPQPPGLPRFRAGALLVTQAYSAMLLISPLVVLALVVFLRRSRFGLALRAAAANPERARLAGVWAARMSTLAWALAGAVAAYTTVLIIPTRGFISAETLGPVLLLRALAPAVVARMSSLPAALGAGVVVGLVDEVLVFAYPTSGVSEVALLVVIVGALLLQTRRGARETDRQQWALLQPWAPLPDALRRVWAVRNLGRATAAGGLAAAVLAGLATSNSGAVTLVAIAAFGLLGLSVGIVTGLGGQLSLGQFALAGVGAAASYAVTSRTGSFPLAVLVAAAAAGALSAALGLPALRVQGLLLGVVTLSFALAAQRWLLAQPWALGTGVSPGRPVVGGFSMDATRRYYAWALLVLAAGLWLSRNVWRGHVGLRLRAVRDNEDAARAFGVTATAVKLQGFAISGMLAGAAGSVYGHLLSRVTPQSFDVVTSINVVALAVLGGIGLLAGPLLGALYIVGVPRLVPLDAAGLAATALGWLVLVLYFPGGLAQLAGLARGRLIGWLARRAGVAVDEPSADEDAIAVRSVTLPARHAPGAGRSGDVLRAAGLVKRYGGVRALDGVDVAVHRGEILGVIGPNGAGKTTLFEVLGGFTRADAGRVWFDGADVTRVPPERRARLGLVRSFQDAALFPTLTVLESVALAHGRTSRVRAVRSVAGLQGTDRRATAAARDLVALLGLEAWRDAPVRELSTGTRRVCELACLVALQPVVLLLDEPSSGIAQRESEALGDLLLRVQAHLGCTMVVIEHDIPMLMGVSTRVLAMDAGRVVVTGPPDAVRSHPDVVRSYLGGDEHAIARSGQVG